MINIFWSKFIVQVCVSTAGDLVDGTLLKELVDYFEHEIFGVEVLEFVRHSPVDLVEVHSFSGLVLFQLL